MRAFLFLEDIVAAAGGNQGKLRGVWVPKHHLPSTRKKRARAPPAAAATDETTLSLAVHGEMSINVMVNFSVY